MNLRELPPNLDAKGRCDWRRQQIETQTGVELNQLETALPRLGNADQKNCEQMLGTVPLPVGYAGPLLTPFSSGVIQPVHLPLATTEGALVASVNRGCKALSNATEAAIETSQKGISRSIALQSSNPELIRTFILEKHSGWKQAAEATSNHLTVLSYDIDISDNLLFLTIYFDTDEAMGMNMATIAAQATGEWILQENDESDAKFITVAGNVDSDKKPSQRTKENGRGYMVTVRATLPAAVVADILKTTPAAIAAVGRAKLEHGSTIAQSLGANLQAANIIAALYLATGQDAAHVVEGSLADTAIRATDDELSVAVHLPAVIVGIRGGGTDLPAQQQCLQLLLQPDTGLAKKQQLAESIAYAVLAGEISLLAAQAAHQLASAHQKLGR